MLSVFVGLPAAVLGATLPRALGRGGLAAINILILVFVGGTLGAMLREFTVLMVPNLPDNFLLDILVVEPAAAFLLRLVTVLHRSWVVSDGVNMLVGIANAGGLSTSSNLAFGVIVLMSASAAFAVVALVYIAISPMLGYVQPLSK